MNAEIVERIVEIPVLIGDLYTTRHVILYWQCPVCGGTRGDVYRTKSYDGNQRVNCDGWQNPCGHIDKYADVLKEAQALLEGKAQSIEPMLDVMLNAEDTPHVPAQVDGYLFGADVARLNAAALHDASTIDQAQDVPTVIEFEAAAEHLRTLVQERDARIQQLETLLQEVREACASINYASEYNLVGYRDHQEIHVHTGSFITDGWTRCIYVNQDDLLTVKHLRAIASVAAKLDAALK